MNIRTAGFSRSARAGTWSLTLEWRRHTTCLGSSAASFVLPPSASRREALGAMEAAGLPLPPVLGADRSLLGVVERDRLTASLLLDISLSLEEGQ